jgi:hypothetical protein
MKDSKLIVVRELKEAIKELNEMECIIEEIEIEDVSVVDMADNFVAAIEFMDEDKHGELSERVVDMYNDLIADELEDEEETEEVIDEKEAETEIVSGEISEKKKEANKKKKKDVKFKKGKKKKKKDFLAELIETGKYSRKDLENMYAEKFGKNSRASCRVYLSRGFNPKYTNFGKVLKTVDGKVVFKSVDDI